MAAEPGRVFCIIQVIGSAHVCDSPGLMMMDQFGSYKFSKVTNQSSLARQSLPPWRNRREENPNWTHGGQQQREKRRKGHLTEGRQRGGRSQNYEDVFFKIFYLLTLFREREREGERERNSNVPEIHGCLSYAPNYRPGPQPRHVPWLGIEPVTFQFAGQHSIHWATPARARTFFLIHILKEGALDFQINKIYFGPYLLSRRTGKLIHWSWAAEQDCP